MNEQVPALDVLVQEKLDADTGFLATLEGKTDEERNTAMSAKRTEIMNTEWSKAQEYARNQKIRAEKAEEKPNKPTTTAKKDDDSNLSSVDTIAIIKANVHEDDIEEVIKASKLLGKSISETLKDSTFKTILNTREEERKTAEATNTNTAKPGTKQVSGDELKQNLSKGQVPEKGSKEAEDLFWARRGGRPN
jgi:hypothetical protein